ncbi:MAG: hypothetical protein ACIAQZ_00185 [Sedimentisphaeraceae bacterium JB056]
MRFNYVCIATVILFGFNSLVQSKDLLITSDFGSITKCKNTNEIRKVADVMYSARPDIVAVDAANPDACNYTTQKGYTYLNDNLKKLAAEGNEPYDVIINALKDKGVTAVSNIRMNDHHGSQAYWTPWQREHIEWSLSKDTGERTWAAIGALKQMDYAVKEVREYRLAIIGEILEKFNVDGLQLDFARTSPFLSEPKMENAEYLTEYIVETRALLDRFAKRRNTKMLLGVIVPWDMTFCKKEGLDVERWIKEGLVDYVCPSEWHYSDWNMPIEKWSDIVEGTDCKLYPMYLGEVAPWRAGKWLFQRGQTPLLENNAKLNGPLIRSLAQNAYSQDADGMMFYNFYTFVYGSYYPLLRDWTDPVKSKEQYRRYFYCRRQSYTPTEYDSFKTGSAFDHWMLNKKGDKVEYQFYFGEEVGDSVSLFRFKIQDSFVGDKFEVVLNNEKVRLLDKERFDHVNSEGKKYNVVIWKALVNSEQLKKGLNQVVVTLSKKDSKREASLGVDEFEILVN